MSENIVVYAGTTYGKQKKKIVEKAADKMKLSVSEFVWSAIRSTLDQDSKLKLKEIEQKENQ